MSLLAALLSPLALASEPVFEPLPSLERPVLAAGLTKAQKAKSGNKSGGKSGGKKSPQWKTSPYFSPHGGVRIYSSNGSRTTVATIGGEVGYSYRYVNAGTPQWRGYSRVSGDFLASGDTTQGLELRGGTFMGPHWKVVGLETGADVFWNRWTYGSQTLDPSLGAEMPLRALFHKGGVNGFVGVSAAWLQDENRRVDWSEATVPGFGHEFAYMAGLTGRIAGFDVGVRGEYRVTAAGPISTAVASASVDGATLQDLIDMARGSGVGLGGDSGSNKGSEKK